MKTTKAPEISRAIQENWQDKIPSPVTIVIPNSINTLVKLTEFLQASGLKRGSQEYNLAYEHYRPGLPLTAIK